MLVILSSILTIIVHMIKIFINFDNKSTIISILLASVYGLWTYTFGSLATGENESQMNLRMYSCLMLCIYFIIHFINSLVSSSNKIEENEDEDDDNMIVNNTTGNSAMNLIVNSSEAISLTASILFMTASFLNGPGEAFKNSKLVIVNNVLKNQLPL